MTTADKTIKDLERAAVEIAAANHAGWGNTCTDGATTIAALLAEVDRLRVDARRYQWLRDFHIGDEPAHINLPKGLRAGLDAAIDNAMAQEVKHGR